MFMKYLLISLLFTLNALRAQFLPNVPYENISFEGLNPDWYETTYDIIGVTDSLDGYNNFLSTYGVPILYYKDLIVKPYFSRSPYGINGSYIECRSIKNGHLLWQQKFTLNEIDHIELIAFMYVDNNDQLVVISHKERKPYIKYDFQFYFSEMIITRRVYNINTGNLITYFHRKYDDPEAFKTSITNLTIGSSKIFQENEYLRYIEKFSNDERLYLKSCLLDETGALVGKVDTMLIEKFTLGLNILQIHSDTLLEVQMNRNTHHLYLRYLSPSLKLLYEVETDSLPWDPTNISLKQFCKQSGKLFLINYFPSNGTPNYNHEFIVLNSRGKITKYGFLPFKNFDYQILEWNDNSPKFLVLDRHFDQKIDNHKSLLRIYSIGPDSIMQPIKSFNADNNLRFATPVSSIKLSDHKYHLNFDEGAFKSGININFLDYFASAQSQMVVDIENLGLPTNLINYDYETTVQLKAYPNPTQNESFIDFDSGFTGNISIYNSVGQKMDDFHISNQKQVVLSTNHYLAGIYYILCKDTNSSNKLQLAKLLKVD